MQLTSCAHTDTRYIDTPAVPIPAALLSDCPIPDIPGKFTWGDSLELNERLITALQTCNNDKAAIREIERVRAQHMRQEAPKQ